MTGQATMSPPEPLSMTAAASRAGVSRRTIDRWIKDKKLAAEKVGRSWQIDAHALDTLIAEEREAASGNASKARLGRRFGSRTKQLVLRVNHDEEVKLILAHMQSGSPQRRATWLRGQLLLIAHAWTGGKVPDPVQRRQAAERARRHDRSRRALAEAVTLLELLELRLGERAVVKQPLMAADAVAEARAAVEAAALDVAEALSEELSLANGADSPPLS